VRTGCPSRKDSTFWHNIGRTLSFPEFTGGWRTGAIEPTDTRAR
jgi:hypothetical protein